MVHLAPCSMALMLSSWHQQQSTDGTEERSVLALSCNARCNRSLKCSCQVIFCACVVWKIFGRTVVTNQFCKENIPLTAGRDLHGPVSFPPPAPQQPVFRALLQNTEVFQLLNEMALIIVNVSAGWCYSSLSYNMPYQIRTAGIIWPSSMSYSTALLIFTGWENTADIFL